MEKIKDVLNRLEEQGNQLPIEVVRKHYQDSCGCYFPEFIDMKTITGDEDVEIYGVSTDRQKMMIYIK